jgi:adenylyltransferase/sulfurtransferase
MTDDIQILPREVKQRLERGDKMLLVDIRQEWEHKTCRIEGSTLVPMETMASSMPLFEAAEEVVVYCHHGVRSLNAVVWLRQQGIAARSMAGGIARWSEEIDPSVLRY